MHDRTMTITEGGDHMLAELIRTLQAAHKQFAEGNAQQTAHLSAIEHFVRLGLDGTIGAVIHPDHVAGVVATLAGQAIPCTLLPALNGRGVELRVAESARQQLEVLLRTTRWVGAIAVEEFTPDQLRREVAAAMGILVAEKPSGNPGYPIAYRLHWPGESPVGHPGGGFFGFGWCESAGAAWSVCPDFPRDARAAKLAREWLRDTRDILLVSRPYSRVSASGRYRLGIEYLYREIGYATGDTEEIAICRAVVMCQALALEDDK